MKSKGQAKQSKAARELLHMLYNWSTEDNCLQNLSKGISLLLWWASHHLSAYVTVRIHVLTYLSVYWIDLRSSSVNPYSLATVKIPITKRSNFWDLVWDQEKLVLTQNWPQLQYLFCASKTLPIWYSLLYLSSPISDRPPTNPSWAVNINFLPQSTFI